MTAQTKLLNSKIITHHSHTQKNVTLNRCNGFSGFGCPDPAETAAVEPVSSPAECCSEQRVESRENSSSPEIEVDSDWLCQSGSAMHHLVRDH